MFDISITVENINFEKTISALMPGILQKCRKISKPNLVLRMLLEMEDDALTVLLGIMQRLSEGGTSMPADEWVWRSTDGKIQ